MYILVIRAFVKRIIVRSIAGQNFLQSLWFFSERHLRIFSLKTSHYRGSIEMQDHHTITVGYVTVLIASGNKAVYDLLHYWLDVDYVHHQTWWKVSCRDLPNWLPVSWIISPKGMYKIIKQRSCVVWLLLLVTNDLGITQ